MTSANNKQIVLDAYAVLNAGDPVGYFASMSDDVQSRTWALTDRRTFRGKGDIMKNFVPVLRQRLEGSIKLHVINARADGD